MTGPKGDRNYCFPKTLNGFVSGNTEVRGKNSLFPAGPVTIISVLLNLPTQNRKIAMKLFALQICHRFKEHDMITCESKVDQDVVSLGS